MAKRSITKAAIEALAYDSAGPSRQVMWDSKISGFGVRVTPEGGKSYVLLYRVNGRQSLMSLGPIGHFKSVDDAKGKAQDVLYKLRNEGVDPQAERKRIAKAESMADLWKTYDTDRLSTKARNTQINVRGSWNKHIEPVVGKFAPAQVTKSDVVRIHDKATKASGKFAANRAVEYLRGMLKWFHDRAETQFPKDWRNPAVGIEMHRELPRKAILDLDQQRKLLAILANEPRQDKTTYVHLLLLTGLRASELATLKWSAIDFESKSMTISDRKNDKDLVLPLPPVALDLLKAMPVVAGNDYVFPSPRKRGAHLTTFAIRDWYFATLDKAGVPRRTFHDLRRSYGTNHARAGVSTKLISELLGNTSEVASRVYVEIAANDLRRLTEANAVALASPTATTS